MGCVSQVTGPPKKSVLRKSSNRTVTFSKSTWHHMKIWERKGPSQGAVQKCQPPDCNPCAPKFEDGILQETLQQERCARREAWDTLNDKGHGHVLLPYRSMGDAGTLFEKARGARIRGRLRSTGAHAE